MGIRFLHLMAGLILFISASTGGANVIVWNNTSGGNWSDSSSWKPKHVPGSADVAVITNSGDYTVTLDVGVSVGGLVLGAADGTTQTLSINGQNFTLSGQATINSGGIVDLSSGTFNGDTNGIGATLGGTLTCSGGVLAGKFIVASNSVLNLSASNSLSSLVVLTNYGTVNWSNMDLYGSSSLQIFNFGLWNAQAGYTISSNTFFGNGAIFNNFGTFRKSSWWNITKLDTATTFNTSGTVDIENGELVIQTGSGGGIFTNASGTSIYFGAPGNTPYNFISDYTLTTNAFFVGSSQISGFLNGSNATLNGTITAPGLTLIGTITLGTNSIINFELGTAMIIFEGAFTNYGTVNWSNQDLHGQSSPQIYNYGLWNAQSDNTFYGAYSGGGSTLFNNYGIFRKSGVLFNPNAPPPYYTVLDNNVVFNNSGTVDIEAGPVIIDQCFDSGTINIVSNCWLSTTCTLTGSPIFSGSGPIQGNLTGSNTVLGGMINFPGYVNLAGTMTIASNCVVNFAGPLLYEAGYPSVMFNGVVLTNYGTIIWSNMDLAGQSSPQICNYGLWDAQTNNTFYGAYQSTGVTVFNNFGVFRKSGMLFNPNGPPPYYTVLDNNVVFNNSGTVDIESGPVIIGQGSDSGTINVVSNSWLSAMTCNLTGSPVFSGSGSIQGNLTGSNAMLNGAINFPGYVNLAGTMTIASNCVVNFAGPLLYEAGSPSVMFNGVVLTNYGAITWSNMDLAGQSGPQICNYGLWDAQTNNTFYGAYQSTGVTTFNNYGTFRKSGGPLNSGQTYFDSNTFFDNSGTVDVRGGVAVLSQTADSGTFNVASNTVLYSTSTLTGNPIFSGDGAIEGSLTGSNAVLNGLLTFDYGTWSGTMSIASNAVVNLTMAFGTPDYFNALVLTNYGTVIWSNTDLAGQSSPQIYNYGLWDVQTNNTFYGAYQSTGITAFYNFGVFRKSGGANGSGNSYLDSNTTFNNTGTVDAQTGILELGGNYALAGGILNFGISSSNSFGSIYLANNSALTGTASVNLKAGYYPSAGDAFPLLSYGAKTGTFTSVILPHLSSGLIWQTNYGATTFTLSVTSAPPFQLSSPILTQGGGVLSFSFGALAGETYQVQCTTNLAPANWINLGSLITATNDSVTVSDTTGLNLQRFYRVVLQ